MYHSLVYLFVQAVENGLDTSVCTLYEIQSGEDSEGEGKGVAECVTIGLRVMYDHCII